MVRDVAAREDRRVARRAEFVDDDAVVDRQPRVARERCVQRKADAGHREIGVDRRAVGERRAYLRRIVRLCVERRERRAEPYVDAVRAMQVEQEIRHDLRHRAAAQPRRAFDHDRLDAELARGRRDFEADPAAADHEHAPARAQLLAECGRFVERAQVMQVRRLHERVRQAARRAAGRDHEAVVFDLAAAFGTHHAARTVDRRGAFRLPRLDVQRVELVGTHDAHGFDVGVAGQHGLRQRRPLVRQMRLVGNHHETARKTFRAQRLQRPAGGLAAADHNDRARRGVRLCVLFAHDLRSVMNLPSGAFACFCRRVLPSRPPSTAHSANTVGPGSNSRGCHSGVSMSSSA
ncbi:Uncharacterised protein [Burkholderia cepacia]|uniref:Uncharacterized protein n=1 Tax=Burkholderia cepacia TaxID=292 RepID=A0AAE8NI54_BURCE|nr:Uncharacterised protein [Burkholderia cepacia]